MIKKIQQAILRHTVRARRDTSEENLPFPAFHPLINERADAKIYRWPYTHIVVDNFLTHSAAEAAHKHIDILLADKNKNFKKRDLYDVYGRTIEWHEHPSLDVFFDLNLKTFIEQSFGQTLTEHVVTIMHNNTPRKQDKYIHSDWSRVFFFPHVQCGRLINTTPAEFETNLLQFVKAPAGTVVERRAITAILYLSPDWKQGDGGETGVFARIAGTPHCAAKIEPRFNRLLIFENSPHSLHNYMASSLPNRNSIIEWFHTLETNVDQTT